MVIAIILFSQYFHVAIKYSVTIKFQNKSKFLYNCNFFAITIVAKIENFLKRHTKVVQVFRYSNLSFTLYFRQGM